MNLKKLHSNNAYIVFVILSAIIYLAWGTLTPTYFIEGGSIDGLIYRGWGVVIPLLGLIRYWTNSKKMNPRLLSELTFFGFLVNYAYILHINHYQQTYILGSFIIQTGANSIIDRERLLILYNVLNLLLSLLIFLEPNPLVNPYFYLTSVGTIAFLMCVMNVIKIQAQRKMLTLEEKLAVEENKRIIVEGLAHEVNNPLMILQTFRSRLLKISERSNSEDMDRIFREIISDKADSISRAITRIDGVLTDLHKTACGNLVVKREEVNVGVVIKDLVEAFQKESQLTFEVLQNGELTIMYDPSSLQKILKELVANAKDFAREKVSILLQTNRVIITNDGPAIPKHLEGKIFEPFFTTKDIGHGKGLGLAISKGLSLQNASSLVLSHNLDGQVSFEFHFA